MKPSNLQRYRAAGLLLEKEFPLSGDYWEERRFPSKTQAALWQHSRGGWRRWRGEEEHVKSRGEDEWRRRKVVDKDTLNPKQTPAK